MALNQNVEVAVFTEAHLACRFTQVETNPLRSLAETLSWDNFLTFNGTPDDYSRMAKADGFSSEPLLHYPDQALTYRPMPCGGLADCGVCAITTTRKKQLPAGVDGPASAWDLVIKLQSSKIKNYEQSIRPVSLIPLS